MITSELLDSILLEWSYRLKDGIPDVNDPEKVRVLNEVLAERELPLYEEKGFKMAGDADAAYFLGGPKKYYDSWIKKIEAGENFLTITGKEFKIDKNSEFYKLFKGSKGNTKKLLTLFRGKDLKNYQPVIPGPGSDPIPLTMISKKPFTQKITSSGTKDLNTEDGKESLAAYFYSCTNAQIKMVENKLNTGTSSNWKPLSSEKATAALLKDKGKNVVDQIVTFLNDTPTVSKKEHENEIASCIQAISVAKKMKELWGEGLVVDRNDGVFNTIQEAAAEITGLAKNLIDKWCPGDVYMYTKGSVSSIEKIVTEAKKNQSIVSVSNKTVGLNSLFDATDPKVLAVSLKEAKAFGGAATSFTSVKELPTKGIDVQTSGATDAEKTILSNITKAGTKTIKNASKFLETYEDEHTKNISKLEKAIESAAPGTDAKVTLGSEKQASKQLDTNKKLYNVINKNIALRKMIQFFNSFKKIRDTYATKYNAKAMLNYENPLEALTAYGVSLSGFNPTFYKIQAKEDGSPGSLDIFRGRDTLSISSKEILIVDAPGKAGYKITYDSKMGQKLYSTTLDVRFKGELQITITIEEFHTK